MKLYFFAVVTIENLRLICRIQDLVSLQLLTSAVIKKSFNFAL